MNLTKKYINKQIDKLIKESQSRRGPRPRLYDSEFRNHFVQALIVCKGNGKQVYEYMNQQNIEISYKQTHEYIRRLFGKYTEIGRPPKYLSTNQRRQHAS